MQFDAYTQTDPRLVALVEALNPAQREAVTAPPEHRLVLAGAGSGKTRVLTHRIAWLMAVEGVSAQSVLAVTFTNKAANEMRGRIEQLVNVPVRAMWVGTFHGTAHKLLRLHWREAKLPQNFQILDADDQQRLVKRVLKGLDMPEDRFPPKMVTGWINAQKEEGRRPHQMADQGDYSQRQLVRAYTAYQQACEAQGLVDFAELLLRAYELFRDQPAVREHYHRKFRHVLVDEFQDTNTLQYLWLRLLCGPEAKIFAVGDDDQCLVAGTQVMLADGSERPIERVRPGDALRSCFGRGEFGAATVRRVHRRSKRTPLVLARTVAGHQLCSTPEHTHFAGYLLGATPQLHFCYLMHKQGVGWRLGTSQTYTRGQAKPMVGFKQRCLQEHADALWVIGVHATESKARLQETLLSLRYGLPMQPFVARRGGRGNGVVHDPLLIAELYASLDTDTAALRLLRDEDLSADEPHHRPQSRNSSRPKVMVTLCGDRRGARPMHRLGVVGNSASQRRALETAGFSVRPAKSGSLSWRVEAARADFGELMEQARRAADAIGGELVLQAHLTDRSLPFIRAASLRPGMAMVDAEGRLQIVESVERRAATTVSVYDLDVEPSHNYIANGLVTHNSIYGWRGAKVENIQKLPRDYPGIELLRLEQNYRSTGTILKAANGLIAHNSGRLGKNLWTEDREGEAIQLYAAYNEYDEAEFVVNRMRDYLDGHGRYSDLAVLYRSNAQSRVMEEMLIRARLPYRIYGGLRFFERMEVKDALAWLRLLVNRDDDGSFERALTTPPRGVGATSLEKLRAFAKQHELSLWKAARSGSAALGRTSGALGLFLDQIDLLDQQTRELPLAAKMEKLIERSGLKEHYKKGSGLSRKGGTDEQAEARLENLDELINAAKSFEKPEEEGLDPVLNFLTHAALEAGEGQANAGEDAVQLMTLHSAKGLEFPVVFMVGLENGLFPSMRAVDEGNLEEERRLCYVGITRARQQLTISYAETRRIHGVEQICAPSQFLKEIPSETLVETRPRAAVLRSSFGVQSGRGSYGGGGFGGGGGGAPRSGLGSGYEHGNAWRERQQEGYNLSRPALSAKMTAEVGYGGYKLGQRVSHPSFGEGTILSFDGEGERTRVEIRFANAGTKWLMLAMAKLSPL
jgi:DNA helicase-2/ATP-dependent DNA helicase PcrA